MIYRKQDISRTTCCGFGFAKRIKRLTSNISESKKDWTAILFPVINSLVAPSLFLTYIFAIILFKPRSEAKNLPSQIKMEIT